MKKHDLFIPESMTRDIYTLTPGILNSGGYKGIIFDLDNTVAPYELASPDEKIRRYFSALEKHGFKIALVSNNKQKRLEIFNESLGFFTVPNAQKPSPKGIMLCINAFGLKPDEVLFVGDQIFTDCLAAHRAGIDCVLVKPIKSKENAFFRFKRFCEKPFVNAYRRKRANRRLAKAVKAEKREALK